MPAYATNGDQTSDDICQPEGRVTQLACGRWWWDAPLAPKTNGASFFGSSGVKRHPEWRGILFHGSIRASDPPPSSGQLRVRERDGLQSGPLYPAVGLTRDRRFHEVFTSNFSTLVSLQGDCGLLVF